jgi:hypothetical protein
LGPVYMNYILMSLIKKEIGTWDNNFKSQSINSFSKRHHINYNVIYQ